MKYYVVNSTYRKEADGNQTLLDQTAGWVDDPTGALFENAEQRFHDAVLDEIYLARQFGTPFHQVFTEDLCYSQRWYLDPADPVPEQGLLLTGSGAKQKSRRVNQAFMPELDSSKVFADFLGEVKVRSSQGPVLEGLYRTRDDRYLLHRLPLTHYRDGDSICWMRAEPAEELSVWAARAWAEENLTPEDFKEAFRI